MKTENGTAQAVVEQLKAKTQNFHTDTGWLEIKLAEGARWLITRNGGGAFENTRTVIQAAYTEAKKAEAVVCCHNWSGKLWHIEDNGTLIDVKAKVVDAIAVKIYRKMRLHANKPPNRTVIFTEYQAARYRAAWSGMRYGAGIGIDYSMTAEAMLSNLEALSEALVAASDDAERKRHELVQLRDDIAGLGRVLRLAQELSEPKAKTVTTTLGQLLAVKGGAQ